MTAALTCRTCGGEPRAGARFCDVCGAPIDAQSSPAEFGEMTFSRWSCGCQDADGVLFPLYHSSSQWAKLRDPEMDKELEAGRSLLDPAARLIHYKRVHEIAEATVPVVPLYQVAILYGARKELRWTPTPNESFFINRMKWED